jgi:hypothetical protein
MSEQECYLEYMWVAPEFRRVGMGSLLLKTVLTRLQASGVHAVWLYILDGNHPAMRLYKRFGFQSTNERVLLPDHPAGGEELLKLRLRLTSIFVFLSSSLPTVEIRSRYLPWAWAAVKQPSSESYSYGPSTVPRSMPIRSDRSTARSRTVIGASRETMG